MVNTSMTISTRSATPIDAQCARVDRYRVSPISIIGVSPKPAGRLIDVEPRTISPVFVAFTGEVCPAGESGAVVDCEMSLMNWHHGTTTTTVFGGPSTGSGQAFDKSAVDFQPRVGPPPPSRPSV